MNALQLIEHAEGYRAEPYYCSEGYPTIGIGERIGPKDAPLESYQFTVSHRVATVWLTEAVVEIVEQLKDLEWFDKLDGNRQTVIISMAYQMGVEGLLGFKKTIAALERGDWLEAKMQALDSRWYAQTSKRALHHAQVLLTGELI